MRKGFAAILLIGLVVVIFALGAMYLLRQKNQSPTTSVSQQAANSTAPKTVENLTDWKTFTLEKITFKYSPNWGDPAYNNNGPSLMAAINKNGERSQQITVTTAVNNGHSAQELSSFLNSIASIQGNKKITLDGSEAVEGYVRFQGVIATIGIYVTAKDKKSQYNISVDNPEKLSDQEMNKLVDQILSTFKFTN